jgi:hypothetical protein
LITYSIGKLFERYSKNRDKTNGGRQVSLLFIKITPLGVLFYNAARLNFAEIISISIPPLII